MLVKPQRLRPSDKISVVAPAGPFDRETFEAGLSILRERYSPHFSDAIFAKHRYLAGSDDHRLADLTRALSDPETRAVFCVRGGYGVMRILARIDPSRFPPKPVVGFSDITALHCLWQSRGRVSIHGPVITQLQRMPRASIESLYTLLESGSAPVPLLGSTTVVPGVAEGPLLGGNLSVLTRLLGTPFLPDLHGAVLLLEDVGERPYRLDRMWTHLRLAGVFQKISGVVLGEFTGCDEPTGELNSTTILEELACQDGIPCAAGFPIGHGTLNDSVALGTKVRLDATARTLSFLEAATATEASS